MIKCNIKRKTRQAALCYRELLISTFTVVTVGHVGVTILRDGLRTITNTNSRFVDNSLFFVIFVESLKAKIPKIKWQ